MHRHVGRHSHKYQACGKPRTLATIKLSLMDIIGIIIGALATIVAVFLQHYLSNRKKKSQKFQLVYVRLMHLKKKTSKIIARISSLYKEVK